MSLWILLKENSQAHKHRFSNQSKKYKKHPNLKSSICLSMWHKLFPSPSKTNDHTIGFFSQELWPWEIEGPHKVPFNPETWVSSGSLLEMLNLKRHPKPTQFKSAFKRDPQESYRSMKIWEHCLPVIYISRHVNPDHECSYRLHYLNMEVI